jgi:hypothetical protein
MRPRELNQASREEIEAALRRETSGPSLRPCRFCQELFQPTRDWQVFCCGKHRAEFNNSEARLLANRLAERVRELEGEVEGLRAALAQARERGKPSGDL